MPSATATSPASRPCSSARTRPRRSTSPTSASRPRRSACARSTTSSAPRRRQDELLELIAELNADETVDGILVQLPLPEQIDQDAVDRRDRPGQGRRRAHRDQRRAARPGPAGAGPVHAAGSDRAPPPRGARDRGRRGGDRSAARSSSAVRLRRCCWARTRPSPSAIRAPATWPRSARAPTSSSPRSARRGWSPPRWSSRARP